MIRLILGRLVGGIAVMFFVGTFAFTALRLAKGSPYDQERALPPEIEANIRRQHRLDLPVAEQWMRYMADVARGDLGWSMSRPGVHNNDIVAENLPYSLRLGATALVFAAVMGIGLGVVAAARRNGVLDYAAMTVALAGISIPAFVLGPILILVFSLQLGWLPPARMEGWQGLVLPALTLGLIYMGIVARLMRSGLLETLRQDYVRTARAKGAGERRVVWKHAFRLGVLPVVTYLGPAAAHLITGTIVIENIFQIPGLGTYLTGSVVNRDYTTLAGMMIVYCGLLVALNLVVDVAYGFIDPRMREGGR